MKKSIDHKIRRARVFTKLLGEQWDGVVAAAACSFCINVLYALSNGVLGIVNRSLWFMAMCAYYVIFSTMRFSAVLCGRKHTADVDGTAYFVMRLSGGLLTLLSLVLTGAAVCLFVCLLGITMIIQGKRRKEIQDEQIEDRSGE